MQRQPRRLCAEQALRLILQYDEGEDHPEADDEENYFNDDEILHPRTSSAHNERGDGRSEDEQVEVEEEDDGNIQIFGDDSDDEETLDDVEFTSAANIQYSSQPFQNRRRQRNILTESSRSLAHPRTEIESFLLFIDESMLRTLHRYTNRKAVDLRRTVPRQYNWMDDFTFDDILACIGILLSAGVDRDNFSALEDLWNPIESRPFYRVVMSSQRFKFFLRCARFDNFRDRRTRLPNDRLAAISEFWQQFVSNLRRVYIPEEVITVDEQLVGYRGRIPGRTYIPSKPRKYGIKIFWACEAKTGYALNGCIYQGKQGNEVHRNLGHDIVMELLRPYFGSGREVVTDNYFTSHGLAVSLLEQNLSLLGTMRSHRREIPEELRGTRRPITSSLFAFDHENKITLVSYIPKKNKNVILLSSSHFEKHVLPEMDNKPEMIIDYNFGKKGVDQLDEEVEEFTCRRKTVRWPLLIFFNMLDVAAFNAFVLMKKEGYQGSRKSFLKNLRKQLATESAKKRFQRNKKLPTSVKEAASAYGFLRAPMVSFQFHKILFLDTCCTLVLVRA